MEGVHTCPALRADIVTPRYLFFLSIFLHNPRINQPGYLRETQIAKPTDKSLDIGIVLMDTLRFEVENLT